MNIRQDKSIYKVGLGAWFYLEKLDEICLQAMVWLLSRSNGVSVE